MQADIRTARASDLDRLVTLENASFSGDRISRRSFRSMITAQTAAVLVKMSGEELAGYAVVLFRTGSRSARLYSIAADPRFAGIGYPLLLAAEREALRRRVREMRLEVRADNDRAIRLYERCGYQLRDKVPDYYEDGATALRFRKTLGVDAAGTAAA